MNEVYDTLDGLFTKYEHLRVELVVQRDPKYKPVI